MTEIVTLQVDFQKICPYLMEHTPQKPTGLSFELDDPTRIASETGCENGGIPGVEKVGGGTITPQLEVIIAYCDGCKLNPAGFNVQL